MTRDQAGRLRHDVGAPASQGGRFAPDRAPGAAAALTRLGGLPPMDVDELLVDTLKRADAAEHALRVASARLATMRDGTDDRRAQATIVDQRTTDAAHLWDQVQDIEEERQRRGGWSRAWLVTSSAGGHVHADRSCSTCTSTTTFALLPHYSGASETELLADAGETACSTCFPDAAPSTRPSRLVGDTLSEQRRARRQQLEEAERARAAGAILTRDGRTPYAYPNMLSAERVPVHSTRKAQQGAVEALVDVYRTRIGERHEVPAPLRERFERQRRALSDLIPALAAATDRDEADVLAELEKKAAAKARREHGTRLPPAYSLPPALRTAAITGEL